MTKYNFNISLYALNNIAPNLKMDDALILDYLRDICTSQNSKIKNKRISYKENIWTWVNYDHLLKEIPVLKINNKSSLTRTVSKLKKAGLIDTTKQNGRKLYFRILDKCDNLYYNNECFSTETDRSNIETDRFSGETNNNINNKENKNQEYIRPLYELYKLRINKRAILTNQAREKIEKRLKEFTPKELAHAIKRFSRNRWRMQNNADKGLRWFFHSEERIATFLSLNVDIPLSEIKQRYE